MSGTAAPPAALPGGTPSSGSMPHPACPPAAAATAHTAGVFTQQALRRLAAQRAPLPAAAVGRHLPGTAPCAQRRQRQGTRSSAAVIEGAPAVTGACIGDAHGLPIDQCGLLGREVEDEVLTHASSGAAVYALAVQARQVAGQHGESLPRGASDQARGPFRERAAPMIGAGRGLGCPLPRGFAVPTRRKRGAQLRGSIEAATHRHLQPLAPARPAAHVGVPAVCRC